MSPVPLVAHMPSKPRRVQLGPSEWLRSEAVNPQERPSAAEHGESSRRRRWRAASDRRHRRPISRARRQRPTEARGDAGP